jgi:hypothetical protein
MEALNLSQYTLDVATIRASVQTVADIVGEQWIQKRLDKIGSQISPKDLRRYTFLSRQSPGNLIEWFREYRHWKQAYDVSGQWIYSLPVMKLAALGQALDATRSLLNFERVIPRLRIPHDFDAVCFEVEVAAIYLHEGYEVDFVAEEKATKTPDLRITTHSGQVIWVECKRRDMLTRRDREVISVWEHLRADLLRELGFKRLNYIVAITAHEDPGRKDITSLYQLIMGSIDVANEDPLENSTQGVYTAVDPTERFEVSIQRICGSDQAIEASSLDLTLLESFDEGFIGGEIGVNEAGIIAHRNPIVLGFRTDTSSDRVAGLEDTLNTAMNQLPHEGPGVVWIRIPDGHWKYETTDPWQRAENLLKRKLNGQYNQRVNVVVLTTNVEVLIKQDKGEGILYARDKLVVTHDTPRTPFTETIQAHSMANP